MGKLKPRDHSEQGENSGSGRGSKSDTVKGEKWSTTETKVIVMIAVWVFVAIHTALAELFVPKLKTRRVRRSSGGNGAVFFKSGTHILLIAFSLCI